MSIPGSANPLLLASAAAPAGYQIERSLRCNSADSAYLSRTPASAGSQTTMTFSLSLKLGKLGTNRRIYCGGSTAWNDGVIQISNGNKLDLILNNGSSQAARLTSTRVFRDPSAWYHIVVNYDSTNGTASDRWRMYVNGERITVFDSASYPGSSVAWRGVNSTATQFVGTGWDGLPFDGYLADIHFIDGQALTPSSFGEFDANNVWQPKAYSGSYGTNGFHLDFADNSAATATTLGKDTSGNGNNWTPNNLSVTAGAGNDSLVDSPSSPAGQTDSGAGGTVVGNYATLNPIGGYGTLANGNLDVNSTIYRTATIGVTSGKWYCEVTAGSVVNNSYVGLYGDPNSFATYVNWGTGGNYTVGAGSPSASFSSQSITQGDVIGIALDYSNGTLAVYRNGTLLGQFSSLTLGSGPWFIGMHTNASATNPWIFNFGQRPFAYTAPSGFKALCTANLPEGTITTSGTFTGNANADGPFIWLNGVPTAMTINSNAVTFGTHADKLANGFKLRTSSSSYNTAGNNTYSITTTGDKFKNARAQSNP